MYGKDAGSLPAIEKAVAETGSPESAGSAENPDAPENSAAAGDCPAARTRVDRGLRCHIAAADILGQRGIN